MYYSTDSPFFSFPLKASGSCPPHHHGHLPQEKTVLHISVTRLVVLSRKLIIQTVPIQCALSPDRSKRTDQIHLIQHCKMLYVATDICDLLPGQVINFGEITNLEERIQYYNAIVAKQQFAF